MTCTDIVQTNRQRRGVPVSWWVNTWVVPTVTLGCHAERTASLGELKGDRKPCPGRLCPVLVTRDHEFISASVGLAGGGRCC